MMNSRGSKRDLTFVEKHEVKSSPAVEHGSCSNARPFRIRTLVATRAERAPLCAVRFRNRAGDLKRSADHVVE
jgi:hypothetical protein